MGKIETCRKCSGTGRWRWIQPVYAVRCATCGKMSDASGWGAVVDPPTLACGHPDTPLNAMPMHEYHDDECDECRGMGKRVYADDQ